MKASKIILGESSAQKLYHGGGNILSIAPAGDGRYSATCLSTLRADFRSALILDPTGEIYKETADAREQNGSKIVKLDPWGLVPDSRSGSFNPIDIFDGLGMTLSEGARFLADFIVPYHIYQPRRMELESQDPFWPNMQRKLLIGLIMLTVSEAEKNEAVLSRVREILNGNDVVYNLAVKLDTSSKGDSKFSTMNPEARAELASFLQLADLTRNGVVAGANQHFGAFGNIAAQRATNSSSFDVRGWIRGENISIYIVGPPSGITSFDTVYRLWLGSLMTPLLQRPRTSGCETLVVMDVNEAFELWPGLSTAITQRQSCQVWTIVSDLSDLKWAFREFYETVLNSFSVIQVLKPRNYLAAASVGGLFGKQATDMMKMKSNEVMVMIEGETSEVMLRNDIAKESIPNTGTAKNSPRRSGGRAQIPGR